MKSMSEVFQLLKEGKINELSWYFDRDGVASNVEYDVPRDVYAGLQQNLNILPFLRGTYVLGANPSIEFIYNGRKFKINKKAPVETEGPKNP